MVLPSVLSPPIGASWVTVTVLAATPVPLTVTVADLVPGPGFAEPAVTVIVALFDPLVGETFSQLPSSVMFQVTLEEMLNVPLDPDADPIVTVAGDTVRYDGTPGV